MKQFFCKMGGETSSMPAPVRAGCCERKRIAPLLFAGAAVAFLALPSIALAAGDAGSHQPSILDLGWFYANFILYCLVMFFLLRGVALRGWAARRERIASSVEKGTRAAAAAYKKLSEAKAKLAAVESEIEQIEARILEDTTAESRKILDDAKQRCRAIISQAELLAASEKRASEGSVHREFAKSIIDEARRHLHKLIDPSIDQSLRAKVLSQSRSIVQ